MSNKSFDDLISRKLTEHESAVPEGSWEAIIGEKKKKRRVIAFWWLTGCMLLVGAGLITYHRIHYSNKKADLAQNKNISDTDYSGISDTSQTSETGPRYKGVGGFKSIEEVISGEKSKLKSQKSKVKSKKSKVKSQNRLPKAGRTPWAWSKAPLSKSNLCSLRRWRDINIQNS